MSSCCSYMERVSSLLLTLNRVIGIKLATFNTPLEQYLFKRLPFGIKLSWEISLPFTQGLYWMSSMNIYHQFIVMLTTLSFVFPSAQYTRQARCKLLQLWNSASKLSETGCSEIGSSWQKITLIFLLIGTHQQLAKINVGRVRVGAENI